MLELNPRDIPILTENVSAFDFDDMALFLDLDGTLAPISRAPAEVGPDRLRNRLLARLAERLDGRLAIVSGRRIEDVDRILESVAPAVSGVHGLERRTASGEWIAEVPHPDLGVARASFEALAAARGGLLVEDKTLSVALHYREAPGSGEAVRELALRLEKATGLVLQEGHMVVEMRTPGPTKGDAVTAFMTEAPFAGARPVYVGDDLTDEAAFAAAAAAGGYGVLVGPERETRATWRLNGVDEVLAWIAAGVATGRGAVLEAVR